MSALTLSHAGNEWRIELTTSRTSARHHNGADNERESADHSCSCYSSELFLAAPGSAGATVDLFYTQICVPASSEQPPHTLTDTGCEPAVFCHAHSIVTAALQSTVRQRALGPPTQLSSSTTDAPAQTSTEGRGRILYDGMPLIWTREMQYKGRAVGVRRSCASAFNCTHPMRRHTTDLDLPHTMGGRTHQGATTIDEIWSMDENSMMCMHRSNDSLRISLRNRSLPFTHFHALSGRSKHGDVVL